MSQPPREADPVIHAHSTPSSEHSAGSPPSEPQPACKADRTPAGRRQRVPLTQLRRGQTGTILGSDLSQDDAALLQAMGVCADARVRLCRAGQPCIIAVGCICRDGQAAAGAGAPRWSASRIGLARPLAARITVLIDE